jgi:hypothetical protein
MNKVMSGLVIFFMVCLLSPCSAVASKSRPVLSCDGGGAVAADHLVATRTGSKPNRLLHRPAKQPNSDVDALIAEVMGLSQIIGEPIEGSIYSGGGTDRSIAQAVNFDTLQASTCHPLLRCITVHKPGKIIPGIVKTISKALGGFPVIIGQRVNGQRVLRRWQQQ